MTQAETETGRDYSAEAVKKRLSHGRVERERSKKPLALAVDGLALMVLLSPYIPGIADLYREMNGAPYLILTEIQIVLFIGARLLCAVPTVLGWTYLIGATALLISLFV